jgi:hypothetical protein
MRPRETRQIVLNATPACGRFILEIGEPCPIQPTFVKIDLFDIMGLLSENPGTIDADLLKQLCKKHGPSGIFKLLKSKLP